MLKKSVYIIGLFSLFAMVACSSGTVDPNANPLAYANESSSSIVVQSISSSSISVSTDSANKSLEGQPKVSIVIKDEETLIVVNSSYHDTEAILDTVYSRIEFSTEATQKYSVVVGNNNNAVKFSGDGEVAVYEKELGATATCDNSENIFFAKFKLGQNNRVEKNIELKNYGSACDSLFIAFEKSCKLSKSKEGLVGACDKDGNLEAYCSYVDEDADFDTLLREFTEDVEKICGEGLCQINKTN
ncbi:MAG: hypothetical protein IJ905_04110 [Fibrobacter sp.]|nr:hypothetical protein [Fibrobacter sp.]